MLALEELGRDPSDAQAAERFKAHRKDLGYALLLQRFSPRQDVSLATQEDIERAALDTIPYVPVIFWSFRLMVAAGLAMLILLILSAYFSLRNLVEGKRWLLKVAVWMIPVPFIASEFGWITAEMGRQPWAVYGMLPTWNAASSHNLTYMIFSLSGFVLLYTLFICVEMYLMFKTARKGPNWASDGTDNSKAGPDQGKGFLGLA